MLGIQARSWPYLVEAKTIALLINASQVNVKAYWFFTPHTLPDKTLLNLLTTDRHEIGLHIVNKPFEELESLQRLVGRRIKYYTIHGTSRVLTQILWRRKVGQKQIEIPQDFPCKSLHDESTQSLDQAYYKIDFDFALKDIAGYVNRGFVLSAHPEWLINSNGRDRGPFYPLLRALLR